MIFDTVTLVFIGVVAAAAGVSRCESVIALAAPVGTGLIVAWLSLETARAASAA